MSTDFKMGFIQDPNATNYETFDINKHVKSGYSLDSLDPDLRQYSVKRYNQLSVSACVGFAMKQALEIKHCIENGINNFVEFSALSIYYGARELSGDQDKDQGTYVTLAAESLKTKGVCREIMHPFTIENVFCKPTILADREEFMNKIDSHFRIASTNRDRVNDIIANLNLNNPVVLGTSVQQSMWAPFKINSEPLSKPTHVDGLHGICIVAYETATDSFIFANAWGEFWGNQGFGKIKADVIGDPKLTVDVWIIVNSSDAWFEKK